METLECHKLAQIELRSRLCIHKYFTVITIDNHTLIIHPLDFSCGSQEIYHPTLLVYKWNHQCHVLLLRAHMNEECSYLFYFQFHCLNNYHVSSLVFGTLSEYQIKDMFEKYITFQIKSMFSNRSKTVDFRQFSTQSKVLPSDFDLYILRIHFYDLFHFWYSIMFGIPVKEQWQASITERSP